MINATSKVGGQKRNTNVRCLGFSLLSFSLKNKLDDSSLTYFFLLILCLSDFCSVENCFVFHLIHDVT